MDVGTSFGASSLGFERKDEVLEIMTATPPGSDMSGPVARWFPYALSGFDTHDCVGSSLASYVTKVSAFLICGWVRERCPCQRSGRNFRAMCSGPLNVTRPTQRSKSRLKKSR